MHTYTIEEFLKGSCIEPEYVVLIDHTLNRVAFRYEDFVKSEYSNIKVHSANWERWYFDNAGRISLLGELKVTLVARVEKVPICKINMN